MKKVLTFGTIFGVLIAAFAPDLHAAVCSPVLSVIDIEAILGVQ